MSYDQSAARYFGMFFILSFLSYGLGTGLVESIINTPDVLLNVHDNKTQFIVGITLMAIIHSVVNIGLIVIMFSILKPFNRYLACGYFSAAIAATIVLIIGTIFLYLLIPLSDAYMKDITDNFPSYELMLLMSKQGGFFAYQIGIALWGIGGLMFSVLLYQSQLVPRFLAAWGFVGYILCISGTVAELFSYPIGIELSLLGGLFEIFLSFWLIVKGFNLVNRTTNERLKQSNLIVKESL